MLNVLALPLYLKDVIFLGHVDPTTPLGGVTNGAVVAAAVYTVVLLTGAGVLLWRYRWVER